MVLNIIKKNRMLLINLILIILFVTGIYCIVSNNYRFYNKPIASVVAEKSELVKALDGNNGQKELYYKQTLTLKIRNTELIGREVEITNNYTSSQINTTKYKKGDDLFLNVHNKSGQNLGVSISDVKRDKYTVLLIALFVVIMIMVTGKSGVLTLVTLAVNILLFGMMIQTYVNNLEFKNMPFLLSIVFTTLTLFILGGIRRKSLCSIISTIITVWIIMFIYFVINNLSEELPYEMMNYISGPDYLEEIFRAGIILGCLGAVMDIAITINSSVHELVETNPSITAKELYRSVQEIGYDIMGTMINVLFFTFASACIPLSILKIINGYSLLSLIRYSIVFDTIRFLIGAIGIVLAIPISSFIAILFTWNRLVKNNDN